MIRTLIFALALSLPGLALADPKPPKGFDQKNAKEHLLKHQTYPASKGQLVASCSDLVDFTAADKKWFADALPEGNYKSAAEVMKAVGIK